MQAQLLQKVALECYVIIYLLMSYTPEQRAAGFEPANGVRVARRGDEFTSTK